MKKKVRKARLKAAAAKMAAKIAGLEMPTKTKKRTKKVKEEK